MNTKNTRYFTRISWLVMLITILITGLLLLIYAFFVWNLPPRQAFQYLTAEGNFPQTVAVTALTGYLIYKYFDMKNNFPAAMGAMAGMFTWFLIILARKFL